MSDMFGDDSNSKRGGPQAANGSRLSNEGADDFGKMLEESLGKAKKSFEKGSKVRAEVMTIGRDNVFVLVDGREGVVIRNDFKKDGVETPLKVGDIVDLYVTRTTESLLELTTKASHQSLAADLEEAFDFETPVEGKVLEVVNGGFRVEVLHKLAFCPFSQIDLRPSADNTVYVGKKYSFLITKFEGGRNIVLSRRKLLELEKAESEGQFMESVKPGVVLNGRVTRLEKFGAFVELRPGIEGLIHISELGWSRVSHPSEVVQAGDSVTVKLLEISEDEQGRMRIALSRKQADQDPWQEAEKDFPPGTAVNASVKSIERFGFLLELKPGIVGLLPRSSLRESPHERELENKKPGERIRVLVQSVNLADRRISLSLPPDQEDQSWQEYSKSEGKGFGTLGDQLQGLVIKKK